MNRLTNKTAIVTGGASGIGKATTLRFVEEGAAVAIWDINAEKGEAFATNLREQGHRAQFYTVNTADLKVVMEATEAVKTDFGSIHILINNAGITRDSSFKKMTPEQWQAVIDVNLTGVFNCTKAVYPHLEAQKWGRIITASSVVGLYGNFGQTNYAATKAGVIGMTQVWAREFGRKGITANAVAPGFIETEMTAAIPENVLEGMRDKAPAGRLGTAEEVASLYLFLASDEAAFINGATISIDGGLTL